MPSLSSSSHSPHTDEIHLPCKTMIIDFSHSFKDYYEILSFYGVWDYECPNPQCRAKNHPLHRHARYSRGLVVWDAESCSLKEERIEILRLKCSSCGETHAVLTMDMIPFFSYSLYSVLTLIAMCMEPDGSALRTEEKTGVSYQMVYRLLLIFQKYAHRLMLFLRLEVLWTHHEQPLNSQIVSLLRSQPPPWPGSRFFEHFHTPLFLHRQSTVSYHLTFGGFFA